MWQIELKVTNYLNAIVLALTRTGLAHRHNLSLHLICTDESDVVVQSELDSTLLPQADTEATCNVEPKA